MDIFHAITQEIESVISCHWLDEFRASGRKSSRSTPSASRSGSNTAGLALGRSRSRSESNSGSSSRSSSISIAEASTAKMSSNTKLMDTEPGGESNQYESIKTVTKPHSKESGQLGGDLPNTATEKSGVDNDRAQQTTENIRYGQNISESGVGGMTTTSSGSANQEGGYGGTEAQKELETGEQNPRTSQQYSAGRNVHDYNIGA